MKTKTEHSYLRTEEVNDIIERIPSSFGKWAGLIVLLLFVLIFLFGYLIQYPDVVTGDITINSEIAPIKLIVPTTGKITLLVKSQKVVKSGDYIAFIQNSATLVDYKKIKSLLREFNLNDKKITNPAALPAVMSSGELVSKYSNFLNALQQLYNFQNDKLYEKQELELTNSIKQLILTQKNEEQQLVIYSKYVRLASKFSARDSILARQKVSSESDFDKSQMNYLSTNQYYKNIEKEIISAKQQMLDGEDKITQLRIQKSEKEKQLKLDLIAAFNDLDANIKAWEEKYIFVSPIDGKVQYLGFWQQNEYVPQGQETFTIIPNNSLTIGKVMLPSSGAGKVQKGQKVIIKLDNYPYLEYGYITGTVKSISLTPNSRKDASQNTVDRYLVNVEIPQKSYTELGSSINLKFESKGTADIVTKERRLIQRLFDNLKNASLRY